MTARSSCKRRQICRLYPSWTVCRFDVFTERGEGMNKKQKKVFTRIIVAAVLMVVLSLLPIDGWLKFVLFMIPYLVIGHDILLKAWKGILNRQVFDENFLMAVATIGAILLGDYKEGVAVMLFYQIGELFQSYAVGKSRRNISELMDIRPDYANIEKRRNSWRRLIRMRWRSAASSLYSREKRCRLTVVIVEGRRRLNTSALTGESLPREAEAGDEVISGCINMTGRAENPDDKGVWRVYGIQDPGSGRKFQFQKIQIREFYFQICKILYAGGLLRRAGAGNFTSACADAVYGTDTGVGRLDLQGTDLPGNQLPVCAGHQYSAQLFCRNRRCQQCRCSGKRFQLSGSTCPRQNTLYLIRQEP